MQVTTISLSARYNAPQWRKSPGAYAPILYSTIHKRGVNYYLIKYIHNKLYLFTF